MFVQMQIWMFVCSQYKGASSKRAFRALQNKWNRLRISGTCYFYRILHVRLMWSMFLDIRT